MFTIEFYKDANNEHRWRAVASNGKITGASCEGYKNKIDCEQNAKDLGASLTNHFKNL